MLVKGATGYKGRQAPEYSIILDVSSSQKFSWNMYKSYVWPILEYGDIMISNMTE